MIVHKIFLKKRNPAHFVRVKLKTLIKYFDQKYINILII